MSHINKPATLYWKIKKGEILVAGSFYVPDTRQTGRLTVDHNLTSTCLSLDARFIPCGGVVVESNTSIVALQVFKRDNWATMFLKI
jgi:hypothetical protein